MTELEKLREAIAEANSTLARIRVIEGRTVEVETEGLARILAAASSWAALVWRKGTERPEVLGWYLVRDDPEDPEGPLGRYMFFDPDIGWAGKTPLYWLDGTLPPLPEATDEG